MHFVSVSTLLIGDGAISVIIIVGQTKERRVHDVARMAEGWTEEKVSKREPIELVQFCSDVDCCVACVARCKYQSNHTTWGSTKTLQNVYTSCCKPFIASNRNNPPPHERSSDQVAHDDEDGCLGSTYIVSKEGLCLHIEVKCLACLTEALMSIQSKVASSIGVIARTYLKFSFVLYDASCSFFACCK